MSQRYSEEDGAHLCVSGCSTKCSKKLEKEGLLANYGSTHYGSTKKDDSENGDHCHDNNGVENKMDRNARKKLLIVTVLCAVFIIVEAVGGTLANSLAIATDAAHLVADFAGFLISLVALHLATRPATKRMSFGWYRAEVMGALVSVLLIWVVTGILVYMAIQRIINKDYDIDAVTMLITSGLAVAFNIIMAVALHAGDMGHTHGLGGHGHSHDAPKPAETLDAERDTETGDTKVLVDEKSSSSGSSSNGHGHGHAHSKVNINVRAAFIHVIGDFFQSIGVFIAAIVLYVQPEWKVVDPICTFIFSVVVLITTLSILRDTMNVLMEGTPKGLDFKAVRESLLEIEDVREIHNLRLWSLTMSKTAASVHLAVSPQANQAVILAAAAKMLRDRYDVHDSTIQMELYCQAMDDCKDCQDPAD